MAFDGLLGVARLRVAALPSYSGQSFARLSGVSVTNQMIVEKVNREVLNIGQGRWLLATY